MKTYLNPSVSRERAERVQMKIDLDMLTASSTNERAAVVLPSSVPADVAAAVRDMCKRARAMRLYGRDMKRAAFMADRQSLDDSKTAAPDMDAPSVHLPFVAYIVPEKERAARLALPLSERRKHAYSRIDFIPFYQSVRTVDMYKMNTDARKTAAAFVADGDALDTVYLDVYREDGQMDGDCVMYAARHVARRQIKNALDTSGKYAADGRYSVYVYMYNDICKADPERADVQDLVSVACEAIVNAAAARLPLADVYAAAYTATNVHIKGERKTADKTVYMDANAGNDDMPLSGKLVSVKGTMRAIIAGDDAHISDFDAPPSMTDSKRRAIDRIMSELTATQRDNIERRALGQSVRQIAAARGCSFQAVDKSLMLARAKAEKMYPALAAEFAAADGRAEYGAHIDARRAYADKPESVMHDSAYSGDDHLTAAAAFAAVRAIDARKALAIAGERYAREFAAAERLTGDKRRRAYHAAFVRYETVKERAHAAILTAVRLADTADIYAGVAAVAARADESARRLAEKAAKAADIAKKTSADKRVNAAKRAERFATAAKNAAVRADDARKAADAAIAARDADRAAHAAQIAARNVAGYAAAAIARAKRDADRAAARARMPRVMYGKGNLCMSDVLYIRHGVQTRKGRLPRVMYIRHDTFETVSAFDLAARQIVAYKTAKNAARR